MPVNHFKTNRAKFQSAGIADKFLKPISGKDLPIEIVEKKNEEGGGKLRILRINNIPVNDDAPISYILDMELERSHYSKPESFKTVEKAVLLFSCWSLYVILIEMKSQLKPYDSGLPDIGEKIKDSIGRINHFLTSYIFDEEKFDDYPIKYYTIIAHNSESITHTLTVDKDLANNELVGIFSGNQKSLPLTDRLGANHLVSVIFKKNPNGSEVFDIDLNDIFSDDDDFENAIHSNKTLP